MQPLPDDHTDDQQAGDQHEHECDDARTAQATTVRHALTPSIVCWLADVRRIRAEGSRRRQRISMSGFAP